MVCKPIVTFPYIKIYGNITEKKDRYGKPYLSFRGVNGDDEKNMSFYTFNAFGDVMETIKMYKVKSYSEVTITAYMEKYYVESEPGKPNVNYSFKVTSIDFQITGYKKNTRPESEDKSQFPVKKDNDENEKRTALNMNKQDDFSTADEAVDLQKLEEWFRCPA